MSIKVLALLMVTTGSRLVVGLELARRSESEKEIVGSLGVGIA